MPEFYLAGVIGFEPMSAGVRIPCLTAWRHPKVMFGNKKYSYKKLVDNEGKETSASGGR